MFAIGRESENDRRERDHPLHKHRRYRMSLAEDFRISAQFFLMLIVLTAIGVMIVGILISLFQAGATDKSKGPDVPNSFSGR
jgi:hypothetical protein